MNFKRLLNTPLGKFFISVILGLGLATLFRKVCTDKTCIVFEGPIIGDFEDKIYKYGDKCYQYTSNTEKCEPNNKKILDLHTQVDSESSEISKTNLPKLLTGASPISAPPVSSIFFKLTSY